MVETLIEWCIGDQYCEGHGQVDTRTIAVGHPTGTNALKKLLDAEDRINTEYGIDLSDWFSEYKDDYLYPEEVEKLHKLGICNDKTQDEWGGLPAISVDDFFDIWKQLIEKADPELTIRMVQYPEFFSKCTGYGLF